MDGAGRCNSREGADAAMHTLRAAMHTDDPFQDAVTCRFENQAGCVERSHAGERHGLVHSTRGSAISTSHRHIP
jgi:hypothetical protein